MIGRSPTRFKEALLISYLLKNQKNKGKGESVEDQEDAQSRIKKN